MFSLREIVPACATRNSNQCQAPRSNQAVVQRHGNRSERHERFENTVQYLFIPSNALLTITGSVTRRSTRSSQLLVWLKIFGDTPLHVIGQLDATGTVQNSRPDTEYYLVNGCSSTPAGKSRITPSPSVPQSQPPPPSSPVPRHHLRPHWIGTDPPQHSGIAVQGHPA